MRIMQTNVPLTRRLTKTVILSSARRVEHVTGTVDQAMAWLYDNDQREVSLETESFVAKIVNIERPAKMRPKEKEKAHMRF